MHEHRRHRIDRVRLPDVVSREVHRALPAGAHAPRQPQLPRRHDGQAARRLRAEHRLHAGAARRAAAADGDGGRGLRRVPRSGSRPPASTRRSSSRSPASSRASFFCSTDADNNQIASFYTGAMADAGQLSFRTVGDCGLAIISPNDPGAMVQYAEECRTLGIRFIFDPGQQCARMSGDELARRRRRRAPSSSVNDYELELLRQKTGLSEADILSASRGADRHARRARVVGVARGADASTCRRSRRIGSSIRPASATRFAADCMKGLALGLPARRLRAARQRGRHVCPRASRRPEPRLHLGRVPHALREEHFGALAVPRSPAESYAVAQAR